jgi:glycosyltransferase involved in cell wall biosynthesis
MRILVVTNRYPPHIMGGYEISCQLVVEGLRKLGHEVKILTSTFKVNRKIIEDPVYRLLHISWGSPKPHQQAWWEASDKRETERLINELQPEVIFLWCGLGFFASTLQVLLRQPIPLVYQIQDVWLPKLIKDSYDWAEFWQQRGNGLIHQATKPVVKTILSRLNPMQFLPLSTAEAKFENVIFCSQFQKDLNRSYGFTAQDDVIIYNCVDTEKFRPYEEGDKGDTIRFLFTGRLCEDKGAHIALQAFNTIIKKGLTNTTLSITGIPQPPFEYTEGLRQFVQQEGLEKYVRFSKAVNNEQMPEIYNAHDVLILPSFHKEGFSMVLLEAMACGLAIVGTTSGGSAELLRHEENSLTFAVGDAEALAQRMERLVKEPQMMHRLAESAQQVVRQRFTLEKMVKETEAYLLRVIGQGKKRITV